MWYHLPERPETEFGCPHKLQDYMCCILAIANKAMDARMAGCQDGQMPQKKLAEMNYNSESYQTYHHEQWIIKNSGFSPQHLGYM